MTYLSGDSRRSKKPKRLSMGVSSRECSTAADDSTLYHALPPLRAPPAMSFVRASFTARSVLANARRYTTASPPAKKPSNLPFYLGGAGIAGLATYIYLDYTSKAKAAQKPKKLQEKSPLDPENFIDFELKNVEPYNHNTARYTFKLADDEASLLPIASCVVVKSASDSSAPLTDAKGKPVIRPYTPVSPSYAEGELAFLIKRYEEGKMSQHIHSLKPGDKLAIKGPIMKFPFKINEFQEIGMIAGGTGITPMYQVLEYALADKSNKTKFTLIFANISERDILLREEFDALKAKYPDTFNVVYTLDKADSNWKGATGFVSKELVKQHLPPSSLAEKTKIFICGPPGQVAAVAGKKEGGKQGPVGGILKELGYTEDQVFKF
ncbi:NADH-cytochrome b5 reductase 2 [Grifola frondosa]|uniref:cytochrome-b5 reductase n=1 Tax=Grifola frondosa TaxID=5627 RepID=A0A1C7LTA3_GRIFR|nr:NADH-cytochrome b5 reductase 2 [Grifola frondosa]